MESLCSQSSGQLIIPMHMPYQQRVDLQPSVMHYLSNTNNYGDISQINPIPSSPVSPSPVTTAAETDDVDIDVVNVSVANCDDDDIESANKSTPCKAITEPKDVTVITRYSTPVSEKSSALSFTPICSPIKASVFRPSPTLSSDSSGYSSCTPVSSVKSHSPSDLITPDACTSSDRPHIRGTRNYTQSTSPSSFGSDHSEKLIHQTSRQCCSPQRNPPHYPQKNGRTTYTSAQVRALERVFQTNQYPEVDTIEEISKEINVPANKIKVWFQNKRARTRRFMGVPVQNTMMSGFMPPPIGNPHTRVPNHLQFMAQPGYLPSFAQIQSLSHMSNLSPMPQLSTVSPMQLYYQGAFGQFLPGIHPAYIPQAPSEMYADYNALGYHYPSPFMYQHTPSQEDAVPSQLPHLMPNVPCAYPSS